MTFGRSTDQKSTIKGTLVRYHIITMVKRTHLVFFDRLQDRKAIKKSTVKYIILFHLKYLQSFKLHFRANAALHTTQQRNLEVE